VMTTSYSESIQGDTSERAKTLTIDGFDTVIHAHMSHIGTVSWLASTDA